MKDTDKGFKNIFKKLQELKNKTLQAGILKDAGTNEKGTYIADYASYNEFGTINMPARPFLSSTFDEQSEKWQSTTGKIIDNIIDGDPTIIDNLIGLLGEQVVGDIKEKIDSNVPPPLSPATIKRKKSTRTLIDTGIMRNSIKYEIVDK